MKAKREKIQKITAHIPESLMKIAMAATHKGITDTIKAGLEKLARDQAYENLRRHKGKVKFSIDFNKLREEDR